MSPLLLLLLAAEAIDSVDGELLTAVQGSYAWGVDMERRRGIRKSIFDSDDLK